MTSTLQQEAGRKLRYTAQTTMRVAQRLYENGYITYMRTDSTTLSESALTAARRQAVELYGADSIPEQPRRYSRKVKNAQEAHEAIRPAGDSFRTPKQLERELNRDELALYDLIWKRTLASQMADARGLTVSLRLGTTTATGRDAEFSASGTVITSRGFLAAYEESRDDETEKEEERPLPHLKPGDELKALQVEPEGHATTPPSRYTEASLVQALEERGIGRPSTYASIIGTILDRGYVFKRGTALVPSFLAFAVTGLLEQHFGRLVDYSFTAQMEDDLDRIAAGEQERVDWLRHFYFGGNGDEGLHALVSDLSEIDARAVNSLPLGDSGIVLRVGRYGPYVERGEERASVPEDMAPDELTIEKAEELLSAPSGDRVLGTHPEWGTEIAAKAGRYGPYVTEVLPEGATEKPRTASLFQSMSPETVTIEDAVRLLSLPRVLGADPADGVEVTAQNGRYGPYVKKDTESRSLEGEEQLFTISLEDALALLAKPKERRGRGQAKPPLRELGPDPVSSKPVVLKEGRFGPYVTDGETNASLRRGDDPETVTIERAAELLADRRSKGPAPKRKRGGGKRSAA
jgi:DNA topoisomerase-1